MTSPLDLSDCMHRQFCRHGFVWCWTRITPPSMVFHRERLAQVSLRVILSTEIQYIYAQCRHLTFKAFFQTFFSQKEAEDGSRFYYISGVRFVLENS